MTTKPPLQNILKESFTQKMKANKAMRGQEVSNHRRRKDKESESSIDSAAHNQTLKNRNHHIPININTECQWTQHSTKRHHLANWVKKEDPTICCLQETHLIDRNKH
jgi:hypothetical protein